MFDIFNSNVTTDSPDFMHYIKCSKSRPDYLYHILPMLGAIPPHKGDSGFLASSVIYRAMAAAGLAVPPDLNYEIPTVGFQFKTAAGKPFSCKTLLGWIKYLYMAKPSEYISSQTKHTAVCSAVPLVLKAYKQEKGIKYSQWDKTDEYFQNMMNYTLKPVVDTPNVVRVSADDYNEAVGRALTTASTGKVNNLTGNYIGYTSIKEFDEQPAMVRKMLLQTWVFHPSVRHEDMILDPEDWDIMPESRSSSVILSTAKVIPKNARDNLPW